MHASGLAALLAGLLLSGCADQSGPKNKGQEIFDLTHSTRETYAVFNWSRVKTPGQAHFEEWGAEMHSGSLHRVETPKARLVADCGSGEGAWLELATGRVTRGPAVAAAACGISRVDPILDVRWLARVETVHGPADRIEVEDAKLIRTYDVLPSGAILRTEVADKKSGTPRVLVSDPLGYMAELPEGDVFSEASLNRSVVPSRYKSPP